MAISLPSFKNVLSSVNSVTNAGRSVLNSTGIKIPNSLSSIETVTKSTLNSVNAIGVIAEQVGVLSNQVGGSFQNPSNSFRNITNTIATIDMFASSLNKQTSGKSGILNSDVTNAISTAVGIFGAVGQAKALSNILQGTTGSISTVNNSIESITSIVPVELNNSNTIFSSPLDTAFDVGRNILQDNRNNTISQINPGLANYNQLLQSINKDTETGIANVLGKIPSLKSTVSNSLSNLNLQTLSSKISNLIPSSISKVATDLGNVINPLSNVVNDINTNINNKTTGINQITSGNSISNFSSQVGNFANSLNQVNNKITAVSGVLQNPNQISNIFEKKINNLVTAKLTEFFDPISNIVGNLSNLGKSLAEQTRLDLNKIRVLAENEIFNLVGGRFDESATRIFQLISNIENQQSAFATVSNRSEESLKAVFSQYKTGRDGSLKLGNELRNFNTYNYIITLGMLTAAQYNNPTTYQRNGLNRILARSGGGDYGKRIQTANELSILEGNHAEYFIEDLEIDSILAPNPNTGVAMGTNISFRIVEPYSMGQFLEAIKQEANANNFTSTSKAPFCLKIEFVGWDEYGNANQSISSQIKPRYIPIIITKMDFSVNEQGSIYDISGVAYPDSALEDQVNSIKTDVSSQGVRVHEILENNNESITREINRHIENLENDRRIVGYDRYLILFPNNKTDIFEVVSGPLTNEQVSALTAAEQLTIEQGSPTTIQPANPETTVVANNTTPFGPPKIYSKLKIWGSNQNNINVIGQSPVIENSNSNRLVKHPDARTIFNSERNLFQRDYPESQVPQKSIAFEYRQGSSITEIIEDIVMNSVYIFDAPEEQRSDAKKKWFRIETMVFIEENDDIDEQLGRPRMTYVYAVHPYFPDEAKFIAPSEVPRNNAQLKATALKEYDYIYTGKNEDIIDFDINFNNAFYQLVISDLNRGSQKPGTATTTDQTTIDPRVSDTRSSTDDDFKTGLALGTHNSTGASNSGTPYTPETESKRRIAEAFHDRLINSTIDMITCDMTIWGDPFYLPTDNGNYRSTPITTSATQDGTMEYLNNEVTCVINFLTPLDYPNKMGQFVMDFPELVKPFSGLFHIWAVTNSFSSGKFTQDLKLIRRPRQIDDPTGTSGPTKILGGRGNGWAELARRRSDAQNRQSASPTSSAVTTAPASTIATPFRGPR